MKREAPKRSSKPKPAHLRLLGSKGPAVAVPAASGEKAARAILPTSPEFVRPHVRRLAELADDVALLSDRVEGQSHERGENDTAMVRAIARVLKALAFGTVVGDERRKVVEELGALAHAILVRDGISGVRLREDGTEIDPNEWNELRRAPGADDVGRVDLGFARGGDVVMQRVEVLRHLHRYMVQWLERGYAPVELARRTCARVAGLPSPLREVALAHGADLHSDIAFATLGAAYQRVLKRRVDPKKTKWWTFAERLLIVAAIHWGMPEREARGLFDFQRKEGQKLGSRSH
jgi:hypothetical protein